MLTSEQGSNIDFRISSVWKLSGYHKSGENDVHYGFIEAFIERLSEKYNIREIVFERRDAVQMVQNLEGMSFTVVPFG